MEVRTRVSLGSAVWARWVVDGDLAYEIDAREIPPDWSTGYLPLRKAKPFEQPADPQPGQMYALNAPLAQWAFNLTRNTPLDDSDQLKQIRSGFDGAASQLPPFVGMGDEISSSTYWHGKLMDAWATEWMRYFTGGKGEFATTAMEDTGTLQSLEFLADAGRVDLKRVLVLRAVSNFDRQPRGLTAPESLARQRVGEHRRLSCLPGGRVSDRPCGSQRIPDPLAAIRGGDSRSRGRTNRQTLNWPMERRFSPSESEWTQDGTLQHSRVEGAQRPQDRKDASLGGGGVDSSRMLELRKTSLGRHGAAVRREPASWKHRHKALAPGHAGVCS